MPEPIYGVRGPDPRNTVVKANDREHAEDMVSDFPGDVVVVSEDGGRTWTPVRETTNGRS
jgi:hypothetical protein